MVLRHPIRVYKPNCRASVSRPKPPIAYLEPQLILTLTVAPEGFCSLPSQGYGASFTVLRCGEVRATLGPRVGVAHSHHTPLKIDVRPSQCEQLPDAQS
jgi:hypothetical protein